MDDTEEAKHTSAVVNELSKEMSRILISHPLNKERASQGKNIANVVLLRGCGIQFEVPTFQREHGLWPCMVAPTKIIAGTGFPIDSFATFMALRFFASLRKVLMRCLIGIFHWSFFQRTPLLLSIFFGLLSKLMIRIFRGGH